MVRTVLLNTGVYLHTSKRMHFIEDWSLTRTACRSSCLHTSKRMHFIEDKQTA